MPALLTAAHNAPLPAVEKRPAGGEHASNGTLKSMGIYWHTQEYDGLTAHSRVWGSVGTLKSMRI